MNRFLLKNKKPKHLQEFGRNNYMLRYKSIFKAEIIPRNLINLFLSQTFYSSISIGINFV